MNDSETVGSSAAVDVSDAALFVLVPRGSSSATVNAGIPKPEAARMLRAIADTFDQEWKSAAHAEQKRLREATRTTKPSRTTHEKKD